MEKYECLEKEIIKFKAYNSKNEDITDELPTDELVYLDSEDKLYLSSYTGGIIRFDNESEQYVHNYHMTSKPIDIAKLEIIELREEN